MKMPCVLSTAVAVLITRFLFKRNSRGGTSFTSTRYMFFSPIILCRVVSNGSSGQIKILIRDSADFKVVNDEDREAILVDYECSITKVFQRHLVISRMERR